MPIQEAVRDSFANKKSFGIISRKFKLTQTISTTSTKAKTLRSGRGGPSKNGVCNPALRFDVSSTVIFVLRLPCSQRRYRRAERTIRLTKARPGRCLFPHATGRPDKIYRCMQLQFPRHAGATVVTDRYEDGVRLRAAAAGEHAARPGKHDGVCRSGCSTCASRAWLT